MCPPNVAVHPAGLPGGVICRLRRLDKARIGLYCLFVVWHLFAAAMLVMLFLVPVDVIEPILDLRWLPEFIGFIIPGLPSKLAGVAVRYPLVGVILLLTYVLIRRTSSLVKAARCEYVFQAWQRTPIAINGLNPPIPEPSAFVKCIEVVAPIFCFILAVAVVFVLLIVLDIPDCFYPSLSGVGQARTTSETDKTTFACANATYPCRLKAGEMVTITIRSDRVPNYTGVILDADVHYTAQFVEKAKWRDDKREVAPEGFQFEENWVGLPRFWWVEWLRPYPEGDWFQLVGRIERGGAVFPVLSTQDASQPYQFKATGDGELVLLVNDVWYQNNSGIMKIRIQRS